MAELLWMIIYKMPFLGGIVEALAAIRFTKSQLLDAFSFNFFNMDIEFKRSVQTCVWKVSICNAVSCAGEPTASPVCLVLPLPWCTQVQQCGELFASCFLAGRSTGSPVNVLSVPEILPAKLEPAQVPFDAGALSQGVRLQRCLWFPETASGWIIFQYKDNISRDKNKEMMNDPVYSWVIAVCFPRAGRYS